jgi:hypothetical protein
MGEPATLARFFFVGLIVVGIVGLKLASGGLPAGRPGAIFSAGPVVSCELCLDAVCYGSHVVLIFDHCYGLGCFS